MPERFAFSMPTPRRSLGLAVLAFAAGALLPADPSACTRLLHNPAFVTEPDGTVHPIRAELGSAYDAREDRKSRSRAPAPAAAAERSTPSEAMTSEVAKVTLGKEYGAGASGNRFQVVNITTPDGREHRVDVRVRDGWQGLPKYTTPEVKARALAAFRAGKEATFTNPEAPEASAIYRLFHGEPPNRTMKVNVPEPAPMAALGEALEIKYRVPDSFPSTKDKDAVYVHKFGDDGHGDTGARPLLLTDGTPGLLTLASKPTEDPMTVDRWLRG